MVFDTMPVVATPALHPAPDLAALRIGVVHNPGSGVNLRTPAAMSRAFGNHPEIPRRDVKDPDSVVRALDELAAQEVNTLAVSGGDGTVRAVLDALLARKPFQRQPLLAVLRAGTTNMIAGDAGMCGPPDIALASLIERAAHGGEGLDIVQRKILRIDPGSGQAPIYGMFFGAAMISQGVEYCKSKVHSVGLRGEIGPGVTLLRFVVAMARGDRDIVRPVPVSVSIDGAVATASDCGVMLVTSLERLFLGLRPFWGEEDTPLHFSFARAQPRYWLRALPGILRGRRNRFMTSANGYVSHNVHRLQLGLDSPFIVDGEFFSPVPGSPLVLTDGGAMDFLRLR
ncbi:MAG: diacylglycerol kinase family protein [Sterolibacterium sp.]